VQALADTHHDERRVELLDLDEHQLLHHELDELRLVELRRTQVVLLRQVARMDREDQQVTVVLGQLAFRPSLRPEETVL
jgi:hypothetical protein